MKGYLQDQKLLKGSYIKKKLSPAWVTAHESWKPGAHTKPAGGSTCWRVSFPGSSAGLSLFQTAQMVTAPPRHLDLLQAAQTSESSPQPFLLPM